MLTNRFRFRKGFISILLLAGCSSVSSGFEATLESLGLSTTSAPAPEAVQPEVKPAPTRAPQPAKNIELLWQIPNEPVDAYHVYLLSSTGEEKKHYRVPVSKLEKVDNPTYGPVYRYLVPDSLKGEAASIVIRAENRFGLSEPSEPMVVE